MISKEPSAEALAMARTVIVVNPDESRGALFFGHPFIFTTVTHRDSYIEEMSLLVALMLDRWGMDMVLRNSWNPTSVMGQG